MAPLRPLVLLFTAATLLSCTAAESNIIDPSVVADPSQDTDYFPQKVQVDSSTLWSIEYHRTWKYLFNVQKNQGYVLYQRGTTKPEAKNPSSDKFFQVPVNNVSTYLTTAVPYLDMLGLRDRIAVVEYEEAITSPCVADNLRKNLTMSINADDKAHTSTLLSDVDVIFQGSFPNDEALEAKSVSTSESQDPGTLRRVEWLEFYSTFFNYEAQANKLTNDMNNNYNCISKKAKSVAENNKPVFAWASYVAPSQYNGNTESWTISTADYKRQLVQDAGGQIIDNVAGGNSSVPNSITFTSSAAFQEALKQVDVLVDETYSAITDMDSFNKYYGFTDQSDLKFIKNKKIYRYDLLQSKSGGVDWVSSGVLMQDAALEDVANALHNGFTKNYKFKWFRNLSENVSIKYTDGACENPSEPLKSYATQCTTDSEDFETSKSSAGTLISSLLVPSVLALVASMYTI